MDVPEQHHLVTIPSRCFNLKENNVPGYNRAKKRNAPDYNRSTDVYRHNYTPDADGYNPAPDEYNRLVVLPDRIFRFHNDAKQEDFLDAGGEEEELRQSMSYHYKDDLSYDGRFR